MILILCERVAGRDLKYFKITRIACFQFVIKVTYQYFTLTLAEDCWWQIRSADFCFIQGHELSYDPFVIFCDEY